MTIMPSTPPLPRIGAPRMRQALIGARHGAADAGGALRLDRAEVAPTPSRTIRFAGLFSGRSLRGPRDGRRRPCSTV